MQRYVIQLISDIEVAIEHAPPVSEYASLSLFDFEEEGGDLGFVPDAQPVLLHNLFCLHALAFPPESRLNRSQVTALLRSIERLWSAYQISWSFPSNLSARRRYIAMTEKIQTGTVPYSATHGAEIDFCEDRKRCPFGDTGHCACRETEKAIENDMQLWNKLNPSLDGEDATNGQALEQMERWLDANIDLPPWFLDEKSERWEAFQNKKEDLEWLYFFRPDGAEDTKVQNLFLLDDEQDFEDFDWEEEKAQGEGLFLDDDDDDDDDFYFGNSDLPF